MISGILLAAGAARRFGGGKLLQTLPDGTAIGLASLRNLQAALDRVVVVTRPGDQAAAKLYASAGAQTIVCVDAALGMGHSLAAGVAHETQARGWVVALADMPNVKPQTTQKAMTRTCASRSNVARPDFLAFSIALPEGHRRSGRAVKGGRGPVS